MRAPRFGRLSRPRAGRLAAFATLAIAAGYLLASCSSDPDLGLGGSTTASSSSGGGTGGSGEGGHPGCDDCGVDTPVCVDGDHCAEACPEGRDACQTHATGPSICCPESDQCCDADAYGYANGDLCRPKGEACPVGCPGGDVACPLKEFCQIDPATGAYACQEDCELDRLCDFNLCCPLGSRCEETGSCPLADLTIDAERLAESVDIVVRDFAIDSCEMIEGCINGPGPRMLMRFDLKTPNIGAGDLEMGIPDGNPLFHYSDCHEHFHFDGYATYALKNASNIDVGAGHKQAFCLLDLERIDPNAAEESKYSCSFQGIQAGWADIYNRDLPCQWVDVTDVAPGSYTLEVTVNGARTLAEESYENNVVQIPVEVPVNTCVNGCRTGDPTCCQAGNPCGWDTDGSCDCGDLWGWDSVDCGGCLGIDPACDLENTCPGGCQQDVPLCCVLGDPCGIGDNGSCDCGASFDFEANDCSHCTTPNAGCPFNSCPKGCSPADPNEPCCASAAACGWDNDGWCDCGGAAWDIADCASCLSNEPDCP